MSRPADEQAWLPFEEFLASGARAPRSPGSGEPSTAASRQGTPSDPGAAAERELPRILAVGELTRHIKDALRDAPRLRDLWVEGEVGQVSISSAGHCYFTLKDERAQVRCIDLPG